MVFDLVIDSYSMYLLNKVWGKRKHYNQNSISFIVLINWFSCSFRFHGVIELKFWHKNYILIIDNNFPFVFTWQFLVTQSWHWIPGVTQSQVILTFTYGYLTFSDKFWMPQEVNFILNCGGKGLYHANTWMLCAE
jgi:hypothetical protein